MYTIQVQIQKVCCSGRISKRIEILLPCTLPFTTDDLFSSYFPYKGHLGHSFDAWPLSRLRDVVGSNVIFDRLPSFVRRIFDVKFRRIMRQITDMGHQNDLTMLGHIYDVII